MNELERFGERIRALREQHGMTQGDLSRRLCCSQSTVSKLENGQFERYVAGLDLRLANAFHRSVLDLVKQTDREEVILNSLYPRFCKHHNPTPIFPRIQDGFGVTRCPDCGEELEGDCPGCGVPREGNDPFCYCCGHEHELHIDNLAHDDMDEAMIQEYQFDIEGGTGGSFVPRTATASGHALALSTGAFHQKLCASAHCIEQCDGPICFPVFGYIGEITFCPMCGQEMISSCPKCSKPITARGNYILNFCEGCGFDFRERAPESAVSPERPDAPETSPAGPLVWVRHSDPSRNLKLANPEAFDRQAYARLLNRFSYAATSVNAKLMAALKALGSDPETAVFTGKGDLRSGYLGLNRWCLTNSPRHQQGVTAARALWTFLFGEQEPSRLADPAPNGRIVLQEEEWEQWYERISNPQS